MPDHAGKDLVREGEVADLSLLVPLCAKGLFFAASNPWTGQDSSYGRGWGKTCRVPGRRVCGRRG